MILLQVFIPQHILYNGRIIFYTMGLNLLLSEGETIL